MTGETIIMPVGHADVLDHAGRLETRLVYVAGRSTAEGMTGHRYFVVINSEPAFIRPLGDLDAWEVA